MLAYSNFIPADRYNFIYIVKDCGDYIRLIDSVVIAYAIDDNLKLLPITPKGVITPDIPCLIFKDNKYYQWFTDNCFDTSKEFFQYYLKINHEINDEDSIEQIKSQNFGWLLKCNV